MPAGWPCPVDASTRQNSSSGRAGTGASSRHQSRLTIQCSCTATTVYSRSRHANLTGRPSSRTWISTGSPYTLTICRPALPARTTTSPRRVTHATRPARGKTGVTTYSPDPANHSLGSNISSKPSPSQPTSHTVHFAYRPHPLGARDSPSPALAPEGSTAALGLAVALKGPSRRPKVRGSPARFSGRPWVSVSTRGSSLRPWGLR